MSTGLVLISMVNSLAKAERPGHDTADLSPSVAARHACRSGMIGGGVISAIIAMVLGYPCFRLRGHYFVIATIVIAEIGLLLFHNWDWAGAATGIEIPVRGDSWLKFQFPRSKLPYFYFALALACVA